MRKEHVDKGFTIHLAAGQEMKYALNNAREVEICTNAPTKEAFDNNKISQITVENLTLRIGDSFTHENEDIPSSYFISSIDKFNGRYKNCYRLASHPETLTSTYVLPCLGMSSEQLNYKGYFVNTYLTEDPSRVVLLYRFSTSEAYGRLEAEIVKGKYFASIDNSVKGFDIFYMNTPKEYLKDIPLFANGSYSKLSNQLKNRIVEFHRLTKKDYIYKVIFKEEDLVKKLEREWGCSMKYVELAQKPNLDIEMLERQSWFSN